MKRIFSLLVWLMVAVQARAEAPQEFAKRFYENCVKWKIRGVPDAGERKKLMPFLNAALLKLFVDAEKQRVDFMRRHPLDPKHPELAEKPPWTKEGDCLSSTYEGITSFSVGQEEKVGNQVQVTAHLKYVEGKDVVGWTDKLVLDPARDGWIIADIRLGGESDGSLVKKMQDEIAEVAKEAKEEKPAEKPHK